MAKKSGLDVAACVLLVIGGLNWGLVGLFNMNIIDMLLGSVPIAAKLVYVLIGLSALYMLKEFKK